MGNITISRGSGTPNQNSPIQHGLKQKLTSLVNAGNVTLSQTKTKPSTIIVNKGQNSFSRNQYVNPNIKTIHKQQNNIFYSLPQERDLKKRIFSRATNHRNYIESNTTNTLNLKRQSEIGHEGKNGYKCDFCDKKFSYAKSLKSHIQKYHEEGPKAIDDHVTNPMCDSCGKLFSKKKYMMRHVRMVHEGQKMIRKPRICDLCGVTFASNLKRHILVVHKGHRDYTCSTCGKDFTHDQSMKKHVMGVHEGQRPHKCHTCDKAFLTSTKLKQHIQNVHEGHRDYTCDICAKAYSTAQALRGHISKNHTNPTNLNNSNNTRDDNFVQKPLSKETDIRDFIQSTKPNEDEMEK